MATLRIPPLLRDATEQQTTVEVPSGSVRSALQAACIAYPALGARLWDGEQLRPHLAVMVDAAQIDELAHPVGPNSEVVIVPAIGGG